MVIHQDRCWLFREKSIPGPGLVGIGAVPCTFSSHFPHVPCPLAQCPSSFPEICHAFSKLRAFPCGFPTPPWESPFPPLGLIN